jgi:hypothetical protein
MLLEEIIVELDVYRKGNSMDSATDQVLDIEIDWETCTITAHLEGFPDPIKCKETLLKLLEPFGDFREFAFTSTFDDDSADPNAMVKSSRNLNSSRKRRKETN